MISKNQIKHIRQLHRLKSRRTHNEFIAEGPKVVGELLHSAYTVKSIFATFEWIEQNQQYKEITTPITEKELAQISLLNTPNQVLCIAKIPGQADDFEFTSKGLCLVLDGISDPGNMGTIVRTADWFGISQLVCSPDCVDIYNPKVIQATMGSITRIQAHYTLLDDFLKNVPSSKKIYGAYLDGENLFTSEIEKDSILIIGSESHGISSRLGHFIHQKLNIPRKGNSGAESLNASVATAIFCSEFIRRENAN